MCILIKITLDFFLFFYMKFANLSTYVNYFLLPLQDFVWFIPKPKQNNPNAFVKMKFIIY